MNKKIYILTVSNHIFRLQGEKKALALKAEEMGRMQSENVEMSDQIQSLEESHK